MHTADIETELGCFLYHLIDLGFDCFEDFRPVDVALLLYLLGTDVGDVSWSPHNALLFFR